MIGVDDAILAATIATALIAGRYVQTNVLYTSEQMNQINEKWTANLQTAFPDPTDYNHQMNVLQNLNQKLLNGEEVDWSKYSGKALYAVLKGVVDVVWPSKEESNVEILKTNPDYSYIGSLGKYSVYGYSQVNANSPSFIPARPSMGYKYNSLNKTFTKGEKGELTNSDIHGSISYRCYDITSSLSSWLSSTPVSLYGKTTTQYEWGIATSLDNPAYAALFYILTNGACTSSVLSNSNAQYVPNITAKTANKVKLPTRLPQTVINNVNNYIAAGGTGNLEISPTTDELPQLPDNYNPNTDELPDLPGYVDVTPDQEPTDEPTPTPTPPDPPPTPPEYDGSGWVNPIGNFLAGLLEFLKTAFVPTQSLDFSPLQNMESGTFGAKFPFSLPSDFGKILGVIQADPITPKFDASIPLSKVGYQDIPMEIDLEPYSNIAGICKSGFVILFCIGLFFLTRRFMSPGG